MGVEDRMLLYTVAFGTAVGLFVVVRRGAARALWFHTGALAAMLLLSLVGVFVPSLQESIALPLLVVFGALAVVPSLIVLAGRRQVRARRFAFAAWGVRAGALLLGLPAQLLREAVLYDALAASERGDEARCAELLRRLHEAGGLAAASGGGALAQVVPLAGARRWAAVLAVLDAAPSGAPAVLSIEARAAAESGDLRRALRACERLAERHDSVGALHAARRTVLAAGGRLEFLREAEADGLPVMRGSRGARVVTLGRAAEARGLVDEARASYETGARRARGSIARDAGDGLARLAAGALRLTRADEIEADLLLGLEQRCCDDGRRVAAALGRRPVATWTVSLVTTIVSGYVLLRWGADVFHLLAVSAVSAPLVAEEGQWWRLFSTMLLHGGWVHLAMNVSCILPVGLLLERRTGPSRWLVVYIGAGFAGSLASVYLNATDVGVGASGAAMGLIGALLVLLMRRPRVFPSADRERWLWLLWVCVGATAAIGLVEHRYVDNAAHGAGFVAGALLGLATLPRPGAAVGEPERGARRAGARLAAALLVALMFTATFEAYRESLTWDRVQVVQVEGARVELPGWLHLRHAREGGVVAARPPAEIAFLIGAEPHAVPRPVELLPEGSPLRDFFAVHSGVGELDHGEVVLAPFDRHEASRLGEVWAEGLRFCVLRNGPAFALVLLPAGEEAREVYAPLLGRIADTLTPTR